MESELVKKSDCDGEFEFSAEYLTQHDSLRDDSIRNPKGQKTHHRTSSAGVVDLGSGYRNEVIHLTQRVGSFICFRRWEGILVMSH